MLVGGGDDRAVILRDLRMTLAGELRPLVREALKRIRGLEDELADAEDRAFDEDCDCDCDRGIAGDTVDWRSVAEAWHGLALELAERLGIPVPLAAWSDPDEAYADAIERQVTLGLGHG